MTSMKVLIVDDSALMRRSLAEMLSELRGTEVIVARDGADALAVVQRERPDVITLDINMPNMDGLTCLSHIMTRFPTPVVMVSSLTDSSAIATFEALEMGAVDYIAKPGGTVSLNIREVRNQLIIKVRAAYRQRRQIASGGRAQGIMPSDLPPQVSRSLDTLVRGVVVIGVSTGGPSTLERILPFLSSDFPLPIVVCQHMPASFTRVFAERLDGRCTLEVMEVSKATEMKAGTVYVCKGDADAVFGIRGNKPYILPMPADASYNWHPSVSRMTASIAQRFPAERVVGVMLTGMGNDGAEEMKALHSRGSTTLAEAEKDCAVFGMPKALIDLGGAQRILEVSRMPAAITAAADAVAAKGVIQSWG